MTDDKVVRVIGASGKLHAFRNLKSLRQPDGIPGAFKMFYAVPGAVDLAGHYEFLAESPVKKRHDRRMERVAHPVNRNFRIEEKLPPENRFLYVVPDFQSHTQMWRVEKHIRELIRANRYDLIFGTAMSGTVDSGKIEIGILLASLCIFRSVGCAQGHRAWTSARKIQFPPERTVSQNQRVLIPLHISITKRMFHDQNPVNV